MIGMIPRRSLLSCISPSVSRRGPNTFRELAATTYIEDRERGDPQFTYRASWIGDWWFTCMSSRGRIDCAPEVGVTPPKDYAMLMFCEGTCPTTTMQSAPVGRPGAIALVRWTDSWKIMNSARFNHFTVYFPTRDLDSVDGSAAIGYGKALSIHAGAGAVLAATLRALARASETRANDDRSLRALLPGIAQLVRTVMVQTDVSSEDLERSQRRKRVIEYLEAHYSDPTLYSDEVAAACGLSRRQLYREFFVGESFAEVLRRLRIEKAAFQLSTLPHIPVGQVAFDCGFASADTFANCFRNAYGCCPREYRSRIARGVDPRDS